MLVMFKSVIPPGPYCYTHSGRMCISNQYHNGDHIEIGEYYITPEIILCPYWKHAGNNNVYCHYLNCLSEYQDVTNLIWDQCKECGINDDQIEDPITVNEYYQIYEPTSRETINYIVKVLLTSNSNSVTHEGITYTLSPSIINAQS